TALRQSCQAYGRRRRGRRFQAVTAMPRNQQLTKKPLPGSPATLQVFASIREKADRRRRSISVRGSTLRLPGTFVARTLVGAKTSRPYASIEYWLHFLTKQCRFP